MMYNIMDSENKVNDAYTEKKIVSHMVFQKPMLN